MQLTPTSTYRGWLTLLTTILLLLSQTTTVFAATPTIIRQAGSNNDTPAEGSLNDTEAQVTEADPADAIQDLEGVESAVVQIEAVGTFRDPQEGMMVNAAGRGSGFIIDPSGIAVTNNHVVTGAGLLKVYIAGEQKPRNARVLGVSECSDLAVIDIQGDGFPYLAWYDQSIKVGLDIYAAGFPLGDPEYTLVKGIVSKAKADGETNWASVDHVIQHDAATNPGNSGGPLVTKDGQVVGVHYAGNAETQQAFAIAEDVAHSLVQELRTGIDIDSIGLNATAVSDGKDFAGIWVSSVASGSPADNAGIQPGDIIMSMEGIPLASDGTMKDYCDILRSHDPQQDTLAIEVLRPDTQEGLKGQLNGRPLETSFSLADQVQEEGNSPDAGTSSGTSEPTSYTTYVPISDGANIVTMDVPEEWKDVREGDWTEDEKVIGFRLFASPDLDNFSEDWGLPGVIFGYSEELATTMTPEDLVNKYDFTKDCKTEGTVEEMPEGFFIGNYKSWNECGTSEGSSVLLVGLTPVENSDYVVLLEVYAASQADLDATDRILDSLVVAGTAGNGVTDNNNQASTISEEEILAAVDTSGLDYEYTLVNNEAIGALIPADWQDQNSEDWTNQDNTETYGLIFKASADLKGFDDTWETAGVSVRSATGLTEDINIDDWLDSDVEALKDDCKYDKRRKLTSHDIVGQSWEGKYDAFTRCGTASNTYYVAALNSVPTGNFVYILFMAIDSADKEAFEVFMDSFFLEATVAQGPAVEESALVAVTDDTGQITINVPTAWSDLKSEDWMGNDSLLGPSFYAAVDVSSFGEDYSVPGLFVGVGPGLMENVSIDTMLDSLQDVFNADCNYNDRYEYEDEKLTGAIDTFTECGEVSGEILSVLAAAPKDNPSTLVVVFVNSPSPDDTVDFAQVLQPLDVADVTLDESGSNGSSTSSGLGSENGGDNGSSGTTESDTPVTTVTVVAQTLNVREGPGTNYTAITTVKKGEELGVIGMAQNCAWLYVLTPAIDIGWVAGSGQYVQFGEGSSCADLEDVSALAPPAPSGGTSSGSSGGSQSGSSNAKKACLQFQNHIGAEATVTMTNKGNGKAETFKVAKDIDFDKCFDPGKYAMTIDVPPPWDSINADLDLKAGDYTAIPIQGE